MILSVQSGVAFNTRQEAQHAAAPPFSGQPGKPPRDIASTIPHQKRWVEDAEVSSLARDEAAEHPNGPFDLCAPREPAAQADVV